jgi:hypothetical protein
MSEMLCPECKSNDIGSELFSDRIEGHCFKCEYDWIEVLS